MHTDIPDTPGIDPSPASAQDALLHGMRWQDLGNHDPRLPPARVIEFSIASFDVSAFERHAIDLPPKLRNAVPKRQLEFLAGRLAARHAIERMGLAAATLDIGPTREPLWQAGVTGSITHTRAMAAAIVVAASDVRGVGIDIEKVIRPDIRNAAREFVITADEWALLEARSGRLSADTLFTLAFSAKESFFKGTFATVGHYFDFSAVRIADLQADSGRLTLMLRETLHPDLATGRSFTVGFRLLSPHTLATSFVW